MEPYICLYLLKSFLWYQPFNDKSDRTSKTKATRTSASINSLSIYFFFYPTSGIGGKQSVQETIAMGAISEALSVRAEVTLLPFRRLPRRHHLHLGTLQQLLPLPTPRQHLHSATGMVVLPLRRSKLPPPSCRPKTPPAWGSARRTASCRRRRTDVALSVTGAVAAEAGRDVVPATGAATVSG